jgi:hypothetical protein
MNELSCTSPKYFDKKVDIWYILLKLTMFSGERKIKSRKAMLHTSTTGAGNLDASSGAREFTQKPKINAQPEIVPVDIFKEKTETNDTQPTRRPKRFVPPPVESDVVMVDFRARPGTALHDFLHSPECGTLRYPTNNEQLKEFNRKFEEFKQKRESQRQ